MVCTYTLRVFSVWQLGKLKSGVVTRCFSIIQGEAEAGGDADDGEKKKRQTRGGKGAVKAKKKTEPQGVKLATAKRGKKKTVTIVMGLASYGK